MVNIMLKKKNKNVDPYAMTSISQYFKHYFKELDTNYDVSDELDFNRKFFSYQL